MAACNSSDPTASNTLVASNIAIGAGVTGQSSTVGLPTARGVSVVVTDKSGAAALNAGVTWTVLSGGGTVSAATSAANSEGVASVTWTLGTTAGTNTLQATIATGAAVTITATGVPGTASAFKIVSGNNQTIALGGTTAPFVVMATDKYGNILKGLAVTWGASGGTLSAPSSTTDASGLTSVTLRADAFTRNYLVTATAGNLSAAYSVIAN